MFLKSLLKRKHILDSENYLVPLLFCEVTSMTFYNLEAHAIVKILCGIAESKNFMRYGLSSLLKDFFQRHYICGGLDRKNQDTTKSLKLRM